MSSVPLKFCQYGWLVIFASLFITNDQHKDESTLSINDILVAIL